jgi:hypothetical protein
MNPFKMWNALPCLLIAIAVLTASSIALGSPSGTERTEAHPERSSKFSVGLGARGIGEDYGSELSVTSPYFGDARFAVKLAWSLMRFEATAPTGVLTGEYDAYTLGLVWSSWVTPRLRAFWQLGLGIVPKVENATDNVALIGNGGFGAEYFPAMDSRFSFSATLSASGAGVVGRSYQERAPFENGARAIVAIHYYPGGF